MQRSPSGTLVSGGNGYFSMISRGYFRLFSIVRINAYAPNEGVDFRELRKVPPKRVEISVIWDSSVRVFVIF